MSLRTQARLPRPAAQRLRGKPATAALLLGRGQKPWQALPTRVARRRTDKIDADLPDRIAQERAQDTSDRAIAGCATRVWSALVPIEGVRE